MLSGGLEGGKVAEAVVRSINGGACRVRYGGKVVELKLAKGASARFGAELATKAF